MVLTHGAIDTPTGLLLHASLEQAQLEVGLGPTAAMSLSLQCITVPSLGACGVWHNIKVQDRLHVLLLLKGKKQSLAILCGSNTRKKVIEVGGIGDESYLFSCRCTSSPSLV
jgi:hypothetical protein